MSDRIVLNVGGQQFETTQSTLMESAFFNAYLNRWNTDGEIFIDRSPHIFKHVLALLRDPYYPFPSKYQLELEYYGIDSEIGLDPLSIINQNIINLSERLDAISKDVDNIAFSVRT
jgi:hypothetical protein